MQRKDENISTGSAKNPPQAEHIQLQYDTAEIVPSTKPYKHNVKLIKFHSRSNAPLTLPSKYNKALLSRMEIDEDDREEDDSDEEDSHQENNDEEKRLKKLVARLKIHSNPNVPIVSPSQFNKQCLALLEMFPRSGKGNVSPNEQQKATVGNRWMKDENISTGSATNPPQAEHIQLQYDTAEVVSSTKHLQHNVELIKIHSRSNAPIKLPSEYKRDVDQLLVEMERDEGDNHEGDSDQENSDEEERLKNLVARLKIDEGNVSPNEQQKATN